MNIAEKAKGKCVINRDHFKKFDLVDTTERIHI